MIEDADHFSVLAPLTRVVAQKILKDTGTEVSISIAQEELDEAMKQEPSIPLPVMQQYTMEDLGLSFSYPYLWDIYSEGTISLSLSSRYEGDNIWDMSMLYVDAYIAEESDLEVLSDSFSSEGYEITDKTISGFPAIEAVGAMENDNGSIFNNTFVAVQKEDILVTFDFFIHEDFGNDADELFRTIIDSIAIE